VGVEAHRSMKKYMVTVNSGREWTKEREKHGESKIGREKKTDSER